MSRHPLNLIQHPGELSGTGGERRRKMKTWDEAVYRVYALFHLAGREKINRN